MIPRPASDEEARRRIRESLDESLIVEASAGTGKTTELINRIVAVIRAGRAKIQHIAAVTFTNKAAGELKLRLREKLDEARGGSPEVEEALKFLEEASIGTIHSFCAQILRERPVEACVDPDFEELNEQEAGRLYQSAFRAWLERRLNDDSPGLRRAFARLSWRDSWDDSAPLEQLQWAGRKLVEWRDYPAAWRRDAFAREEEIRSIVRRVRELAEMSARPRRVTDSLYRALEPVRHTAVWIERHEGDFDALEARLLKLGRDLRRDSRKGSGPYGDVTREALVTRRDELAHWIDDFRRRADADLAAALREEMIGLVDEYEQRKRGAGKLDFVDLLIQVRNLVRKNAEVRRYLQNRFSHLFVDEFQDTDPLQSEILLLLAADDPAESNWDRVRPAPGKLFLVGDPKQSIYKFRRADMVLYRQIRDGLMERGAGFVQLAKSYRSVPNIQRFINIAFETEMTGDVEAAQAEYRPLEQERGEIADRPSVIALPVPRPYKSRIAKEAINRSLPDAIAAFVAWIVNESGWNYLSQSGISQRFRARDICVLFRRRTQGGSDLTREYARALEARGIEHLLAGSKSFHRREEIEAMRAALTAIEWPDDELHVFATLKGSLFAIADEILLRYRHAHGRLHPFHRPAEFDAAFAPVADALALLGELHRARNRRPFAATVNALTEATRAHAGFVLRPGGNQILANVARLADLARSYEVSGGISFRGFVEELAAQAEKEEAAEAPVLEEDSDGVRLMTVHGAKGLEFPVVILADVTANLAAREPDQFIDGERKLAAVRLLRCAPWELVENEAREAARERAEGVRVAYVAATRARDLLVVPAIGDEAFEGWLAPLNKALYPSRADWRKSSKAAGCPEFGHATVIDRPLDYGDDEISVRPGQVRPEHGTHEVVWWDPRKLALDVEGGFGVRLTEMLKKDDGSSLSQYGEWQAERARVLEAGARPEFDVFLASQVKEAPESACRVEVEFASERGARPGGRRFGTLVHAVMRDIELNATHDQIEHICEWNARAIGATAEERDAAPDAVEAALRHPLLEAARAASRCYREYPVALALEGGRVLEGVIDLAFEQDGRWTIVDFKTDADSEEARARYERQLQWYAVAMEKLTAMPARAVLLGV